MRVLGRHKLRLLRALVDLIQNILRDQQISSLRARFDQFGQLHHLGVLGALQFGQTRVTDAGVLRSGDIGQKPAISRAVVAEDVATCSTVMFSVCTRTIRVKHDAIQKIKRLTSWPKVSAAISKVRTCSTARSPSCISNKH